MRDGGGGSKEKRKPISVRGRKVIILYVNGYCFVTAINILIKFSVRVGLKWLLVPTT